MNPPTPTSGNENPLHKLMSPRSIAFMGASSNIIRMGSILLVNIIIGKFKGPVYPVHPTEEEVLGLKAYKNLQDLPEVPDLLVLVIPTKLVPSILEQAGQLGINRAVIVTAGYDEISHADGQRLQKEIDEIVDRYGIRYVGPNCIGIFNGFAQLNTAPTPNNLPPGKIGMLSHSGTYLGHMFDYLNSLGFNFGEGISLGNAANIDLVEGLEYFEQRDEIEVVTMYIEGLRRPREFLEVARRVSQRKPLVALYVGGTQEGARSAATHTAALSGPDHIFDSVFRQAGIVRAYSMEELLDFGWAFATQPLPAGNRMAVLSVSGGPGTSMADSIGRCGLELAALGPEVVRSISEYLPHTGSAMNPIDITYSDNQQVFLHHLPKLLLECDEVDGLLVYGFFGPGWLLDLKDSGILGETLKEVDTEVLLQIISQTAKDFAALVAPFGKPVLGSSFQTKDESVIRTLRLEGIPLFPSPERAVKAMDALYRYKRFRDRKIPLEEQRTK